MLALAGLELLWEWQLAPLRPGGSWLALKALPLVLALAAIREETPRARFAVGLLLLAYFTEGVVRAFSETGRAAAIAGAAALISTFAFVALYLAARTLREARRGRESGSVS